MRTSNDRNRIDRGNQARADGLIRVGVATYVLALLLIAAFSITFHFVTTSIVRRQDSTARIVNISGRQRMLSQRIARLTLERAAHSPFVPDSEALASLNLSINLLEKSHAYLIRDIPKAKTSDLVRNVYFGEPWHLDVRIRDFLAHAHTLAQRNPAELKLDDPELIALQAAARQPLLDALNAAVDANQSASEIAIAHLRAVVGGLTLTMLLILLLEALFLYRPLFKRLARAHVELILAGRTDPLTGCLNRRAFSDEGQLALARVRASGEPLSVLMLDIDHFKSVNDRFGHATGDRVITAVVATLLHHTRADNIVCRMGGEEFAVMLIGNTLENATIAAEHLRQAIADAPIALDLSTGQDTLSISVSIGVALLKDADTSVFVVLGRADKALYRAKLNGRNRVETEATEAPEDAILDYPRRIRP